MFIYSSVSSRRQWRLFRRLTDRVSERFIPYFLISTHRGADFARLFAAISRFFFAFDLLDPIVYHLENLMSRESSELFTFFSSSFSCSSVILSLI